MDEVVRGGVRAVGLTRFFGFLGFWVAIDALGAGLQ
jgi:hypothetical protein